MSKIRFAGAEHEGIEGMSPLGVVVADLLGDWAYGIYHLNTKKVDWSDPRCISITLARSLATFDSDELTRLVFLCHERFARMEISAACAGRLRLSFWMRKPHQEGARLYEYHPSLDEAVKRFKGE